MIRFLGLAGVILFLFGILGGFIVEWTRELLFIPLLNLVFGALAIIFWFSKFGIKSLLKREEVGRVTRFSFGATIYIAVFLALLVAINLVALRHDLRWDLTEEKAFSLSEQSESVMQNLKAPLKIVAIKMQGDIEKLLGLYRRSNPDMVSFEVINPETKPHLVEAYGFNKGNLILLSYGENKTSQLAETSEQSITNAIKKLVEVEARRVYFIVGHGEPDINDASPEGLKDFSTSLSDEQFLVSSLFLAETGKVPEDASLVVLVSPTKSLPEAEFTALKDYVEKGGRLLIFGNSRSSSEAVRLAAHFGITIRNDLVLDQVQRLFAGPALGVEPVIRSYAPHPITKYFNEGTISILHMTSSVGYEQKDKESVYTELAKTGDAAWGETNLDALFNQNEPTAEKGAEDTPGPVSVAVAYEKKLDQKTSRVVVFGGSTVATNQRFSVYSNKDLLLNVVNWLGGVEGGLTIRPKELRKSTEPVAKEAFLGILRSALLVPEIILLLGLFIWWRRRSA